MSEEELKHEVARLRAELDALKAGRSGGMSASAAASENGSGHLSELFDHIDKDEVASRLKDLAKRAEREIKDSNPLAILGVFVLGLILGKLFSK